MIAELEVYNWEHIKRWPIWYIAFISITIFLIVFSFFQWNIMWWISVIFISIIVLVSYIILYLISLKKIKIQLYESYFLIDNKIVLFSDLLWFDVDIDEKWNMINFVLIYLNSSFPIRYKIISANEITKEFIIKLVDLWLTTNSSYMDSMLYKFIRFLKLW